MEGAVEKRTSGNGAGISLDPCMLGFACTRSKRRKENPSPLSEFSAFIHQRGCHRTRHSSSLLLKVDLFTSYPQARYPKLRCSLSAPLDPDYVDISTGRLAASQGGARGGTIPVCGVVKCLFEEARWQARTIAQIACQGAS
jgi:hypothetical protein